MNNACLPRAGAFCALQRRFLPIAHAPRCYRPIAVVGSSIEDDRGRDGDGTCY